MQIPVFLSYPRPFMKYQEEFISELKKYLKSKNIDPKTLGVTDYDMAEPLIGIRGLLHDCNGILTIAFKRSFAETLIIRKDADIENQKIEHLDNCWITSPYCHIETAMAFQIGLPILILKEKDVIADGILEKGVAGINITEFDCEKKSNNFLNSNEWKQILWKWESCVRRVYENKRRPPKLY